MNVDSVLHAALEDYALPWGGDHGIAHRARVLENGLRLAGETGANVEVVGLFAVLHDSRRVSEATDPDHGPRAAESAVTLRESLAEAVGSPEPGYPRTAPDPSEPRPAPARRLRSPSVPPGGSSTPAWRSRWAWSGGP